MVVVVVFEFVVLDSSLTRRVTFPAGWWFCSPLNPPFLPSFWLSPVAASTAWRSRTIEEPVCSETRQKAVVGFYYLGFFFAREEAVAAA